MNTLITDNLIALGKIPGELWSLCDHISRFQEKRKKADRKMEWVNSTVTDTQNSTVWPKMIKL